MLVNVLQRINKSIKSTIYSYVYYNELSGEIMSISNTEQINEYQVLKVEHEQVRNILEGRYKYSDYIVTYDNSQKMYVLKRADFKLRTHDIRSKIYEVKKVFTDYYHKEIYKGMHVDVWYKELEHTTGQHVWYNKNVYKAINNISMNVEFNTDDYELVVNDVKLYRDKNINLYFEPLEILGEKFLKDNYLYSYVKGIETDDCYIEQDLRNKQWFISIAFSLKEDASFRRIQDLHNKKLFFNITRLHDPNILYRSIGINLKDLLDSPGIPIPFIYDWEEHGKDVSIFTNRYLDSYAYRVKT